MTDNLRIWSQVEKTNPAHTKHVNQRGGFTSISAQYQVLAATAQFGPIGIGWGYISGNPIICDRLVMVPVTLWHGSRENTYGPMIGCDEWKDAKDRIDSDAPKKAVTDALTKLLSQLGFNADVFLGRFDDSKYVEALKQEFAETERQAAVASDANQALIMTMATTAGVPLSDILTRFKIRDLRELPADSVEPLRKKLQLTIDQRALAEQKEAA